MGLSVPPPFAASLSLLVSWRFYAVISSWSPDFLHKSHSPCTEAVVIATCTLWGWEQVDRLAPRSLFSNLLAGSLDNALECRVHSLWVPKEPTNARWRFQCDHQMRYAPPRAHRKHLPRAEQCLFRSTFYPVHPFVSELFPVLRRHVGPENPQFQPVDHHDVASESIIVTIS